MIEANQRGFQRAENLDRHIGRFGLEHAFAGERCHDRDCLPQRDGIRDCIELRKSGHHVFPGDEGLILVAVQLALARPLQRRKQRLQRRPPEANRLRFTG
jgi:hypothetical protein